jgi:hypothetical protein
MMQKPIQPTGAHFQKLFTRASPLFNSPEKHLVVAILAHAVADALCSGYYATALNRRDAESFFREGAYRPFCEMIDLDPDWVAMVLRKYGGIECGTCWVRAA